MPKFLSDWCVFSARDQVVHAQTTPDVRTWRCPVVRSDESDPEDLGRGGKYRSWWLVDAPLAVAHGRDAARAEAERRGSSATTSPNCPEAD
jgi:hypothetical protein